MDSEINTRDADLLSVYIDNQLNDAERAALERRLAADPVLRRELTELQQTVALLGTMPLLKAPRNFTLDAAQVAPAHTTIQATNRRWWFALSSAAAMMLVVIGLAIVLTQDNASSTTPADVPQVANAPTAFPTPSPTQQVIPEAALFGTADDDGVTDQDTAETEAETEALEDADTEIGESAAFDAPPAQPEFQAQPEEGAADIAPEANQLDAPPPAADMARGAQMSPATRTNQRTASPAAAESMLAPQAAEITAAQAMPDPVPLLQALFAASIRLDDVIVVYENEQGDLRASDITQVLLAAYYTLTVAN